MTSRALDYPFKIEKKPLVDSTTNFSYNLQIDENILEIVNTKSKKQKQHMSGLWGRSEHWLQIMMSPVENYTLGINMK